MQLQNTATTKPQTVNTVLTAHDNLTHLTHIPLIHAHIRRCLELKLKREVLSQDTQLKLNLNFYH